MQVDGPPQPRQRNYRLQPRDASGQLVEVTGFLGMPGEASHPRSRCWSVQRSHDVAITRMVNGSWQALLRAWGCGVSQDGAGEAPPRARTSRSWSWSWSWGCRGRRTMRLHAERLSSCGVERTITKHWCGGLEYQCIGTIASIAEATNEHLDHPAAALTEMQTRPLVEL